ncbi:DUF2955 domain-containing protein [Verrucomicrobiaceae bacterium N1E253]|uniref:DUF2955 domain-containing protein n=1 Tax=Oceaniferula marina TaxID=2748318 RepID=A0A851GFZ6_9BACT|nr:DUF2955 domain-containing protein [Oceaniferula marina]NWK55832.1 DUF2955 domain-containing protein [Oceaniferula marina]
MTLANVRALRISLGATLAVAVAYGVAWPLSYIMPIFAVMFLSMPGPWFGWKMAIQIIRRLSSGLLMGLIISEFFLRMPLVCVPLYALLFFWIFFKDATAPPLATIFMTMGITMVPILGLQTSLGSHFIVTYLFISMSLGFVFTWLGHLFIPNRLAKIDPNAPPPQRPAPPPTPSREERARLALVSTAVATSAVLIFFAFNLAQYALAMFYICMMASTPNTNASIKVLKANSTACLIGGIAIVIVYNLLVCVPTYDFLVGITLLLSLFFSIKMTSGKPSAAAWTSGFTTFLVLLGSSTGGDSSASSTFYLRIAQVLFAGIFCIGAIIVTEHLIQRSQEKKRWRLMGKALNSGA